MTNFYCKYCGKSARSVADLTGNWCPRYPSGKGRHELYQGSEKSKYTCMYCGTQKSNIADLTGNWCYRHPSGSNKGRHEPAL